MKEKISVNLGTSDLIIVVLLGLVVYFVVQRTRNLQPVQIQTPVPTMLLSSPDSRLAEIEEDRNIMEVKAVPTITVTSSIYTLALGVPWNSFNMVNDGPDSVYVAVNNIGDLLDKGEIKDGEEYASGDMGRAMINTMYFQCASGCTASLRVRGNVSRRV